MARFDPVSSAGKLMGKARGTDWKGRAKQAVQTLKDEYEAGKRGDDAPAQPIWASPKEQLDAVVQLLRGARDGAPDPDDPHDVRHTDAPDPPDPTDVDGDADAVAEALRGVDWSKVRAATSERGTEAARTVRTMAEQVDWAKVQPVAAQVSTALIAAVASGQLGVGGRLGSAVARAIVDQGGLAQRVARRVPGEQLAVPVELRQVIDTTAREH